MYYTETQANMFIVFLKFYTFKFVFLKKTII